MLVIIIIAVILGIIAWLISAIFGLGFDTVFLWCVLSVCGLMLLLLLNPMYWKLYYREQKRRRKEAERLHEEWIELHKDDLRREERREARRRARAKADVMKNGKWNYQYFFGAPCYYDRYSPFQGYQRISEKEFHEKYEDVNMWGW